MSFLDPAWYRCEHMRIIHTNNGSPGSPDTANFWIFGLVWVDLAKVCSEKISLIELHCCNGSMIFYSPYIYGDISGQICSGAISGIGLGLGWISVWGYYMSTALRC